jgi:hypothetical protein
VADDPRAQPGVAFLGRAAVDETRVRRPVRRHDQVDEVEIQPASHRGLPASASMSALLTLAGEDLRQRGSISRRHLFRPGGAGVTGGRSGAPGARPERQRPALGRSARIRTGAAIGSGAADGEGLCSVPEGASSSSSSSASRATGSPPWHLCVRRVRIACSTSSRATFSEGRPEGSPRDALPAAGRRPPGKG